MPRLTRGRRVFVRAGMDYALWREHMRRVARRAGTSLRLARRLLRHDTYLRIARAPRGGKPDARP